jgi:hypothetical protein
VASRSREMEASAAPLGQQHLSLDAGLQRGEDEEEPQETQRIHVAYSLAAQASGWSSRITSFTFSTSRISARVKPA